MTSKLYQSNLGFIIALCTVQYTTGTQEILYTGLKLYLYFLRIRIITISMKFRLYKNYRL